MRREPANVTLPEQLVTEARELRIDVSESCENGLLAIVTETKREKWIRENLQAMQSWNDYVEEHGLPLASYQQF